MPSPRIDPALADRLYRRAKAGRWHLPRERFTAALEASAGRVFHDRSPSARELERYLTSLQLEDVALASACAVGVETAWDHFVREQRPTLYRAADALDPGGGARDLADSLYAELYGLAEKGGERQSLFRYFHGRSTLATWLRAVLAQRHVDRFRARRRLDPLPEDDGANGIAAPGSGPPDPDRERYLPLIRAAIDRAIRGLAARERIRLRCYYAQELTLAQTGRLLKEHEATVSRQLARSRRTIRRTAEGLLREEAGLNETQIARCFECALEDTGPLDLSELLGEEAWRKKSRSDRSL
jgi:RNA polymerase sigma-70 factor (ECF subfamily)